MSWSLVNLEDVTELITCGVAKKPEYFDSGIPFLSAKNVKKGKVVFNKYNHISIATHLELTKNNKPMQGDILYTRVGSVGEAAIIESDNEFSIFVSLTLIKVVKNKLFNRYLKYLLNSKPFKQMALDNLKGIGVGNLNVNTVRKFKIPLPPLPEQKKIAEILDAADSLRQKNQQLVEHYDRLSQSLFLDMFDSNSAYYNDFLFHKIEDLAENTKSSMRTGPFGSDLKHSEFVNQGIAVIGIDNAVQNKFTWGERRFITPEKYEKLKRYRVYPDDLIITIMGTTGRIAVIPKDIPLAITTKHLATITLNKNKVTPDYLAMALKTHPYLLKQILKSNKGAIMDGLNLGLIKTLIVPTPKLSLQKLFIEKNELILKQRAQAEVVFKKSEDLFNSLLQRAFKGELTHTQ